jgi:hypothetical protein
MDLTAFRFNVGIRTLDAGATINLTLRDQAGNIRGILSRTFDSNAFEQFDARSFLGGLAPGPNDSITIDVVAGGLFVYGVSADNQTNDGAIQDAQKVSGM